MNTLPPRPARIFRLLALSLALFTLALALALFGVHMEDLTPAKGVVVARGTIEIRARRSGLVDLERPLRPGDELAGGDPIAVVRVDESVRLAILEGLLRSADVAPETVREIAAARTENSVIVAPATNGRWLVVDLPVCAGQMVHAGDRLASLAPVDRTTHKPLDLLIRVEIDERHFGAVETGQPVRVFSAMYPHRLHGTARGFIEHLEPAAVEGADGGGRYVAWARVDESPFDLKLGSSVRAEIVVGRKQLVQIILEH